MKKLFKEEFIAVFLFFCIFIYLFLIRPVVSVADNGDFERVMVATGLRNLKDEFFSIAQIKYSIVPTLFGINGYLTSHALCVYTARLLNIVFVSRSVFDVRFLSLIYAAATLCGIYYIVKSLKTNCKPLNLALIIIMWIILCDSGYTPYLNSLYGEGSSYSFLIMAVGISLKVISCTPAKKDIVLLFFSLTMFFASKLQYTLLCPLSLILLIPLYKNGKLSRNAIKIGLSIMIALNALIYLAAPRDLTKDTLYQSVFYGILKNTDDVHAAAQSIGLDSKYEYLAGTNAYEDTPYRQKDAEFHKSFFDNISRGTVIKYYITHPTEFWKKMDTTTRLAFDNLRGMFSNYTAEDGPGKNSFFLSYNSIKQELFPEKFLTLCIIYAIYIAFIVKELLRNSKNLRIWLLLMIMAIGVFQFPLPVIGNGEADIAKQLYIFNLTFDIMICTAFYFVFNTLYKKIKS